MLIAVRIWILLSALLVGGGWVLSAVHELNRTGYFVLLALGAGAALVWGRGAARTPRRPSAHFWHKLGRRFRRPAPMLFCVSALACLIGGALYFSANWDTNSYRVPRLLHWLGAEQWHWIRTGDVRMNVVGCGYEWMAAPLILFTGSDQFIFLVNLVSFALLPGLIFSVFTRLGARARVAWWWMWILPSGWCFLFQAASTANDMLAACYALASVDLALRARQNGRAADLWLSLLAAGLTTGVKQSAIPLAALWLVAAWPCLRLAMARPKMTALTAAASLLVSAAPVTFFNFQHSGKWDGLPPGPNVWGGGGAPWKMVGNLFSLPIQNLRPPFLPGASAWNAMMQRFLATPLGAHFVPFERFGYLNASISEYNAGIGLGVCTLVLVSVVCAPRFKQAAAVERPAPAGSGHLMLLRLVPWFLLLVFMASLCSFESARLLGPYYPFLLPLLLVGPGQALLVRRFWWRALALTTMLAALALLAVSPQHPLLPMHRIADVLKSAHPQSGFLSRFCQAYTFDAYVHFQRSFPQKLPPDARTLGYGTSVGDLETVLWLPFGERRVKRILPGDTSEFLRGEGVQYAVLDDIFLAGKPIERWRTDNQAALLCDVPFDRALGGGALETGHIYLLKMQSP